MRKRTLIVRDRELHVTHRSEHDAELALLTCAKRGKRLKSKEEAKAVAHQDLLQRSERTRGAATAQNRHCTQHEQFEQNSKNTKRDSARGAAQPFRQHRRFSRRLRRLLRLLLLLRARSQSDRGMLRCRQPGKRDKPKPGEARQSNAHSKTCVSH